MKLRDTMVAKAEGVSLWASLAVGTLERRLLVDDRLEDMTVKIDSLPSELEDLFRAVFDSILQHRAPSDRKAALITLFLMLTIKDSQSGVRLGPYYDPPLLFFSYMEDFTQDPDFGEAGVPTWKLNSVDVQSALGQRLRRARKQIYYRCNALAHVTVSTEEVQAPHHRRAAVAYVHRSVDEFLRQRLIRQQLERASDGFDVTSFYFQILRAELRSILGPAEALSWYRHGGPRQGSSPADPSAHYYLRDERFGYGRPPHGPAALRRGGGGGGGRAGRAGGAGAARRGGGRD